MVIKERSPVKADKTPQNSPGQATYSKSYAKQKQSHSLHIDMVSAHLGYKVRGKLSMSKHFQSPSSNEINTTLQISF